MEIRTREIDVADDIEQIAVISDIHGFSEPLCEVDKILDAMDPEPLVISAGDLFYGGIHPFECLEWVRRRAGERAVVGNHDVAVLNDKTVEPQPAHSVGSSMEAIGVLQPSQYHTGIR